jgi:tetratricopeptide (TPR) repeat protein
MYYGEGNTAASDVHWQQSLRLRPSGWAYRNLAVLNQLNGRHDAALSYYRKANQLLPDLRPLRIEYCEALLAASQFAEVLALIESSSEEIRRHSRVRLLEAQAGLALDLPDRWQPILQDDYELVDIREGETSLTDIWFALRARARERAENKDRWLENRLNEHREIHVPLPSRLDFQVMPSRTPARLFTKQAANL